ncbi:MAG: helix-turn-helix transcriptional regulator [Rhizobiaceae bacterium]|nr:helix-turn-helix transcriptional regulator [Rhizobiaceae bacterium]
MELRIGKKEIVGSAFPLHRPLLYCPTAEKRTAIFQSPFNTLRIYLPQDLIKECYETVLDKAAPNKVELFETHFSDDLVVDKLTRALVALADDDGPFGPSMVEAAGLALGARLLALSMRAPSNPIAEKYGSLAKWRLRRTIEYLEENLTDPIYLADLATVAGLSRMHFAAQFRAATGLSPHVYIIRRRIEVAQQLMLDTNRSIADISIAVGFSSQAHFTSAFKKINGVSPGQWRGRLLLD